MFFLFLDSFSILADTVNIFLCMCVCLTSYLVIKVCFHAGFWSQTQFARGWQTGVVSETGDREGDQQHRAHTSHGHHCEDDPPRPLPDPGGLGQTTALAPLQREIQQT